MSATRSFDLYGCKCNSDALGNMVHVRLCVPHHENSPVHLHIALCFLSKGIISALHPCLLGDAIAMHSDIVK